MATKRPAILFQQLLRAVPKDGWTTGLSPVPCRWSIATGSIFLGGFVVCFGNILFLLMDFILFVFYFGVDVSVLPVFAKHISSTVIFV